jgi:hypothetical protein
MERIECGDIVIVIRCLTQPHITDKTFQVIGKPGASLFFGASTDWRLKDVSNGMEYTVPVGLISLEKV